MNVLPPLFMRRLALLLGIAGLGNAVWGAGINVTRGPYLQQGTTNGVVVRWRTDVASDSLVRCGTNAGTFIRTNSHPTVTNEHVVTVTGLQPGTKYFYELGSAAGWYSGDTNDFFATFPTVGAVKSTRIWVLGDSGTANAGAVAVRDAYLTYTANRPADLLVMLGDNAYNSGTDTEYQNAVFNLYPSVLQNTVLWSTIGNHDTAQSSTPPLTLPYFNIFTLPQAAESGGVASGTEKYYSFDYGNLHFICLDAMSSDRSATGPMSTWLRADLEATAQQWLIAFWHHPPYTKGSHDSDSETELIQMRQNMLPILESYGVDLVLCGHSHSYERSFLLDGHYGISSTLTQSMKKNGGDGRENGNGAYLKPDGAPDQGAVYAVCGSSGQTSGGTLNHPAMFLSLNSLGSLVLDVNSNRLDLVFLKTDATAGDYCTIIKTPPATNAPAAPTGLAATAVSSSQIDLAWLDNATDEEGFKIERSTNGVDFVPFATVGANITGGADTGLAQSTTYYYRVRAYNTAGNSTYANIAQATTLSGPVADTLVPLGSVWKFLDNGSNQGTNWIAPAFNDSTWASGPAELGYGDGGEATIVSYGPNSGAKYITTYFRRSFNVANPAAYTNALVRLLRDDGAVVYLRGQEIFRSNMPGGAVSYTTLASTAVGGADESALFSIPISPTNFVAGVNVFAVEIHQSAANSSDLGFNLELTATGPPPSSNDTTAPAAVGNLTVSAVTGTSVTLLWTAPGDDGITGTALSYDVRSGTAPITEANWAAATQATGEPAPATAGNSQAFTVNGLTAGVTYFFALKTSDEAGNTSPLSNVPTVTTPIAPPAAPGSLVATTVSSGQIDLVWNDNANNEAGFKIERSTNGLDFTQIAIAGANAAGYSDHGVAAATTYSYRVRAYNAGGDSGYSNESSATTLPLSDTTPPAAVANLAASSVSSNAMMLTWTAPGDDGISGTAAAYDLRYSPAPITEANWSSTTPVSGESVPLVAGSAQSLAIGGLTPQTTYYFAVKSTDEAGNVSPLSNVPGATTLPIGLPSPWLSQDVGAVAATGSAIWSNGVFLVRGSGADISGKADEFRFVFQAASGDCEIRARVTGVQNTHPWAKAGVMIRESLNANSGHAMMVLTAGGSLSFQRRPSTGGNTSSTSGGSATAPYWVRVVRTGNTFTASKSANGTTWTTVGSATVTMGASVQIGLVVTSRSDGTLNTSTFDNVTAVP
jgi:hypothetical protein